MTIEELGSLGEVVGAIGVIVSLAYLAIQIRQNTRTVRSASFQEAIRDVLEITDALAMDPDLARIYWKGLEDFGSLDRDERRRFSAYLVGMFRRFENLVYQTRYGALDADSWLGVKKTAMVTLRRRGATEWWSEAKDLFNEEFQDYVDRELMGAHDR